LAYSLSDQAMLHQIKESKVFEKIIKILF